MRVAALQIHQYRLKQRQALVWLLPQPCRRDPGLVNPQFYLRVQEDVVCEALVREEEMEIETVRFFSLLAECKLIVSPFLTESPLKALSAVTFLRRGPSCPLCMEQE